jgi:hypothetical protein
VLYFQLLRSKQLVRTEHSRLSLLSETKKIINMPALHRRHSAAFSQSVLRILPDRFEQAVARHASLLMYEYERLFHQLY